MLKNRLVTAVAALSLLAVPAVASAHRSDKHSTSKHHAKKHKVKKTKVRTIVRAQAPSSTTTPSTTTPTPAVTATVTSFSNGDLTITVNGKPYTAAVTDRTELECQAGAVPVARTSRSGDDDHGDDNKAPASAQSTQGVAPRGHDDGDDDGDNNQNDDGDRNDDNDDDDAAKTTCDATSLTPGTTVTEAEMSIGSEGATWKKVELLK